MSNQLRDKAASVFRKIPAAFVVFVTIVCTGFALRVWYMHDKVDFHIDEGFSASITNFSRYPMNDKAIRDRWITSDDLISRAFNERFYAKKAPLYNQISRATGEDVHPPLYYWALALVRKITGPERFPLAGFLLNSVLFVLTSLLLYILSFRVFKDWKFAALTLALYCFSTVSASLTTFIRMYELLGLLSLCYASCAFVVLDPVGTGIKKTLILCAALAGLGVFSFLGLMTQYYFLFCLAPIALVSAIYLVGKGRFASLFIALVSTLAGLYLAGKAFPEITYHLTSSYRATQSVQNTFGSSTDIKLGNITAYLTMVTENLVPLSVLVCAAGAGLVSVVRNWMSRSKQSAGDKKATVWKPAGFVLALAVFLFTIVIIPISAPYITARYIGSFFPLYALAFAGLLRVFLHRKTALVLGSAAAVLVLAHSILAGSPMEFHEDYTIDVNTSYMRDSKSIVIFTTPEGFWKNMLPYINLKKGRRVYVTYAKNRTDVESELKKIAYSSGESEIIALVDDWFAYQPGFEKIGYYAFYHVYAVKN